MRDKDAVFIDGNRVALRVFRRRVVPRNFQCMQETLYRQLEDAGTNFD